MEIPRITKFLGPRERESDQVRTAITKSPLPLSSFVLLFIAFFLIRQNRYFHG